MPDIILPDKVPPGMDHAALPTVLVVSQQPITAPLIASLARAMPAFLLLAHSSSEALELTGIIKPDLFVLEASLPEMSGIELYERLHRQPGFTTIPALLLGPISLKPYHIRMGRMLVNLPLFSEPSVLRSVLKKLLSGWEMPDNQRSIKPTQPGWPQRTRFFYSQLSHSVRKCSRCTHEA